MQCGVISWPMSHHEMRTPITVLMGFLETMQSLDLDRAQQNQYFEMMMSQAQRMRSLVEDLLTLANLEANTLLAPLVPINIQTIMALLKNGAEALSQGRHKFNFCHFFTFKFNGG